MEATAFTSPSATKINAIIAVTSEAFTGSLSFELDFESHWLTFFEGKADQVPEPAMFVVLP